MDKSKLQNSKKELPPYYGLTPTGELVSIQKIAALIAVITSGFLFTKYILLTYAKNNNGIIIREFANSIYLESQVEVMVMYIFLYSLIFAFVFSSIINYSILIRLQKILNNVASIAFLTKLKKISGIPKFLRKKNTTKIIKRLFILTSMLTILSIVYLYPARAFFFSFFVLFSLMIISAKLTKFAIFASTFYLLTITFIVISIFVPNKNTSPASSNKYLIATIDSTYPSFEANEIKNFGDLIEFSIKGEAIYISKYAIISMKEVVEKSTLAND